MNPFRVAQVVAPTGGQSAAAARTPVAAKAVSCTRDEDCSSDSICQNAVCQAIPQRTNILYLYYRDGSFVELMGLYWAKRGPTGFRVVVPFYWHFWSPSSKTRVVAPFYWRFEDYAQQHFTTVIVPGLPVSWSSEPGASSWAVWPLFYKSTRYGWAAPLLGTFAVKDPALQSTVGAVAFLYWWKRSPAHDFDLLFPLFVSSRSKERAFTFALPLTFYRRNGDDTTTIAVPFFYRSTHKTGGLFFTWIGYRSREGKDTTGSLFWLYWYGRNDADRTAYDVGFPLIWSFRGPRRSSVVGFPLVWHFRDGDSSDTVVLPLFWRFATPSASTTVLFPFIHARRDNWTLKALFPIWWSTGDPQAGYASHTLFPLFYWRTLDHGRKARWLSWIGGYNRDDDQRSRTLALLPGLVLHDDPQRDVQVVTPLFIRHHNKTLDSTTKLIAGLLYLRNDPQGSTSALFPLFWRFRDAPTGATATMFFPFFFHRSGPRDTTVMAGVFPLWFYGRSFRDGGFSGGLFPLAFFGRQGDDTHAVVFPLLWHFGHSDKSSTLALPLFYTHADRHGRQTALLPLLTFFGNEDGERYTVQFPLFWRFSSERDQWSTTVTPIGFFHGTRDGWSVGVGPLIPLLFAGSSDKGGHFALVPLFWHFRDKTADRTTTVVLNYLHRRHGNETTDALFPLLHYRRGTRPGGTDETSFTLFPLVHYRRDAQSRVIVTPLGGSVNSRERQAGFAGPFFWFQNKTIAAKALFPLYADVTQLQTGERTRQYGVWFQVDAPGRHSHVLFPLYGHHQDSQEKDTYVFPTYFRQRRADGYHVDALIPLFWRSGGNGFGTTVIGTWYHRYAPGLTDTGLAPLWFYAKNDQRSITVVPPLLLYRKRDFQNDTSRLLAALVYHSRDQEVRHRTVVFPLWWSGHEKERSHAMLLPFLYMHFANSRDDSSWSSVGPMFWSAHGQERTRGLLPVAWYSSDPSNGSGSVGLMPLFYRSHGPGRSAFMTVLGGFSRTPTSNLWYVGPVVSRTTPESTFRMVAPLWFRHTNKATETTTQIIPPLLSVSRTTPEGGLTTALALFWRYRDIGGSTTIAFPLYYDFHEYHQSRFSLLLPLVARYERHTDQNIYWYAPLVYRHTTPTDATTVVLPLWWDFKRGQNRTTVLFPFYASWKRPGYQSTYVFPTYYYREGQRPDGAADGTWVRVVAPFFRSAVYRPGDYMWEVLGGLFGQERIGRRRFMKVGFFRFETEPPTHAQTSWYSKPLRSTRKAPTRDLTAAAW